MQQLDRSRRIKRATIIMTRLQVLAIEEENLRQELFEVTLPLFDEQKKLEAEAAKG